MIGNLLKYVCAKIYENSRSYCKSKAVHFLAYTVEAVFMFFIIQCSLRPVIIKTLKSRLWQVLGRKCKAETRLRQ